VPAIFLVASLLMVLNALYTDPRATLMTLVIIAAGIPVYWLWARRGRSMAAERAT
jgi:Flp pilus assembly protein TadB